MGAAPDLVSDQRPPPAGEVTEWDEAFAVAAGSEGGREGGEPDPNPAQRGPRSLRAGLDHRNAH
eukprot:13023353-Alexandrium_andersonii.AAC.1